jgi:hypothetical protein
MEKWEYLFMDTVYDMKCKSHKPVQINRKKIESESDVCIDEYCNKLGEEGWELINAHEIGAGMRLYFKRRKA